jgi:NADH-ubiquinone oxidoreductase chain 3
MSSMSIFFIVVSILAILFLLINFIFAPHNPYQEKYSIFECGFHSFLGQNRMQFGIKFFIVAILYLIFDIEILVIYPFATSMNINNVYGLSLILIFILVLTAGFVFELGKNALKIDSRQSLIKYLRSDNFVNIIYKSTILVNIKIFFNKL